MKYRSSYFHARFTSLLHVYFPTFDTYAFKGANAYYINVLSLLFINELKRLFERREFTNCLFL